MWWSKEGIKGCGVLPLYALKDELELDGGSTIIENIVELKLKSTVQDSVSDESDWNLENENEVRSSNNENQDDQEQLSYSLKEEEHHCCSIGTNFFTHFLVMHSILVYLLI